MEHYLSREAQWGLKSYNTLEHHGIKGQKWGVRRTAAQLGHKVESGFRRAGSSLNRLSEKRKQKSTVKKTSAEVSKKKSIHEMSESELREKINRMNLEKQYKSLYKELHPKQITAGEKFVKSASSILGDSVKNIAGQTATYVMGQEMNKLLRKAYPDDARPIDPKKGQGGGGKK